MLTQSTWSCGNFRSDRRLPLRAHNVAKRLGRKTRTIRYLAQLGRIAAFKIDRKSWGFWPEDVENYRLKQDNCDE